MISAENNRKLQKLLLSLNNKLSPTIFFISCNTERLRKSFQVEIQAQTPQYKHVDIDLTPHKVYNLRDAFSRYVPKEILESRPLQYVLHIKGLSASLFETTERGLQKSMLPEELNFERDIIFHDYPFISIIWDSPYFYNELFFKAPDLISWLVDRYEFIEEAPDEVYNEVPYKEPIGRRGVTEDRSRRITELENLLERLNEENADQGKVISEKINVLLLLGRECMEALQWEKAEFYLLQAKEWVERIMPLSLKAEQAYFYLGNFYSSLNKCNSAIAFYDKSLQAAIIVKDEQNFGNIYHQMGLAYQKKHSWKEALDNYNKSIEWNKTTGNDYDLGKSYNQIGRVHEEQENWPEALENYAKAIDWNIKAHNEYLLGITYNLIGIVYAKQRRWKEAFENYKKAIEWNLITGNEFELGNTYHQLGRLYEERRGWSEALNNYFEAIRLKQKTGNEFKIGETYHQIGMIYAAQQQWLSAIDYYTKAVEWKTKTGNKYDLGGTYHQIGTVYAGQHRWKEALENYAKAVEWNSQTGNEYILGKTFHEIGRVYEEQGLFEHAKNYFEKAVGNFQKYDNLLLSTAQQSLERVWKQLKLQPEI